MKKIIFLDIDGVLNNPGTYKNLPATSIGLIETSLVERLNKIIDATSPVIVLSSSWKYKFKRLATANSFLMLACQIKAMVVGFTPNLKNQSRGEEIKAWIEKYRSSNISNFIILDDDNDMGELMPHLIKVNGAWGLSEENVTDAIHRLNR